jgi:hypothetical protein
MRGLSWRPHEAVAGKRGTHTHKDGEEYRLVAIFGMALTLPYGRCRGSPKPERFWSFQGTPSESC